MRGGKRLVEEVKRKGGREAIKKEWEVSKERIMEGNRERRNVKERVAYIREQLYVYQERGSS